MPYTTIAQAKKEGFPTKAEGVPMTIDQINKLAAIYDAVKDDPKIKTPFAVAWAQWKKIYEKSGNSWVKRKTSEKMIFPISVEDLKFAEGKRTTEIQVLMIGNWKHPVYGGIKITQKDIDEFIYNFDNKVRKDIPITEGHSVGEEEKPAVGWFRRLVDKGREGLWALIEWTKEGKNLLEEKAYKYFSPEFYADYEDPESHKTYSNVLVGGALTNRPYFKGLKAIVLSELTFDDKKMLTLEEILKKEVADLTDEEKALLIEKKDELSDEDKEKFKDVLKETEEGGEGGEGDEKTDLEKVLEKDVSELTEDEKKTIKDNEDELSEEQKETYKDILEEEEGGEGEEGTEGSEKTIQMSEKTAKILERNAKRGAEAMTELEKQKATIYVEKMIFSELNKIGPLLPKSQNKVVEFLLSLTEGQQKVFKEILAELPKAQLFSELGEDTGISVKASEQIQKLAKEKMSKDEKLTLRQATEQVLADNPELAKNAEKE